MPKRTLNKLDPRTAATLKTPGRHSDGGGLYLYVGADGRRRWIFMYVRGSRRVELGLGGGRDLTLANARKQATIFREMLAAGEDPRSARHADELITFGDCADQYVESMRPSWRNAKHAAQWTMTLTKYAAPLRPKSVQSISTDDVLKVLKPLWHRTPETAERLRGRIESVIDAAKAKGLRSGENPARWRGHLSLLLPKRQRLTRGHHSALHYSEVPAFMSALRTREAVAARALEFAILTAARSGEVLGLRWDEVDFKAKVWSVPASRMKAGREHRVPLSPAAAQILQAVREQTIALHGKCTDFVFNGPGGDKPLSSMAMTMLLRRLNVKATVHGFRSSFRDWASETTSFAHEVCEMALAHTIGNKAEAAYRRGDLLPKRRALMDEWAEFCAAAGRPPSRKLRAVKEQLPLSSQYDEGR